MSSRSPKKSHKKQAEFPNETLSPSWDLHQAIHQELTNLPNFTIHHIKGHQDRTTPNADVSQEKIEYRGG
jgi:hypothetical protein